MSTLAMSGWDDVLFLWTPFITRVVFDYHVRILIRWWNVTNMMDNRGGCISIIMITVSINVFDEWLDWCSEGVMTCCYNENFSSHALCVTLVLVSRSSDEMLRTWWTMGVVVHFNHNDNCEYQCFRWMTWLMSWGCDDVLLLRVPFITRVVCDYGVGISIRWWNVTNMMHNGGVAFQSLW